MFLRKRPLEVLDVLDGQRIDQNGANTRRNRSDAKGHYSTSSEPFEDESVAKSLGVAEGET